MSEGTLAQAVASIGKSARVLARLSRVPAIAKLQQLAGPGVCCICLKPLKRRGKPALFCWSADCRTYDQKLRGQHRTTLLGGQPRRRS